jgi:hypothetical protein
MINKTAIAVMLKRPKRTASNLVNTYGDRAEEICYLTLSGDDLSVMLEAIKDYRNYKEEGWKIVNR